MARMACNVYVLTEEGETRLLLAGSTPPQWAMAQLGGHTLTEDAVPADAETGSDAIPDEPSEATSIPPHKGKGSGAAAWAKYAKGQGFEVAEDAKASEIREALEEAGVPIA